MKDLRQPVLDILKENGIPESEVVGTIKGRTILKTDAFQYLKNRQG